MGGLCSKSSHKAVNAWAADNRRQGGDDYKLRSSKRTTTSAAAEVAPPPAVDMDTAPQPPRYSQDGPALVYEGGDATDDFYDGIPRYKSGSFRKAKVRA